MLVAAEILPKPLVNININPYVVLGSTLAYQRPGIVDANAKSNGAVSSSIGLPLWKVQNVDQRQQLTAGTENIVDVFGLFFV